MPARHLLAGGLERRRRRARRAAAPARGRRARSARPSAPRGRDASSRRGAGGLRAGCPASRRASGCRRRRRGSWGRGPFRAVRGRSGHAGAGGEGGGTSNGSRPSTKRMLRSVSTKPSRRWRIGGTPGQASSTVPAVGPVDRGVDRAEPRAVAARVQRRRRGTAGAARPCRSPGRRAPRARQAARSSVRLSRPWRGHSTPSWWLVAWRSAVTIAGRSGASMHGRGRPWRSISVSV